MEMLAKNGLNVTQILGGRTRATWLEALGARDIPCSPVHTLGELSAHPQTEASDMILRDGDFRTVASPLRADGERPALRLHPPLLGEHTRAVLAELGYHDNDIEALIANSVVGTAHRANTNFGREP
jgi:crotonobetainyl-CoA:carnitine CoA-transferase CaiB-like acyl-CoA transferase